MNKWICALFALAITPMAVAGNYILKIDGVAHEVDVGEQKIIQTKKGEIKVSLEKKAIASYSIDSISFEHSSALNPSVSVLSDEVKQVLLAEANGDLFLVQLYKGVDGSILVPLLENEMTKEEVGIGYKKSSKDVELKLDNGEILKGRHVETEKGSDRYERFIVGCTLATGGLIAVVQTSDLVAEGQNKSGMMNALKSLKPNCTNK